ncbi:MAG: hypothetical protein ACI8ZM_001802 [Crocinitomix sp.]|jgi:hypothetical protein
MEYRKRKGSDTWHWSTDCPNWPVINYDCKLSKQTQGQHCEKCKLTEKEINTKPKL